MTVHAWPAHTCLITELAAELLAGRGVRDVDLRTAHVILPTERLGTWLLALLSEKLPAFLPPRVETFARLVERAGSLVLPDLPRAASEKEQELLLSGLLAEKTYRHLRPGHAHELVQLFKELADWGRTETAYAELRTVIARDVVRDDTTLTSLSERIDEIEDAHARLVAVLAAADALPAATRTAKLSAALAEAVAEGEAKLGEKTYAVGFTSQPAAHHALFAALAARDECAVWISEPPPLRGERNPLAMLVEAMGQEPKPRTARGLRREAPSYTVFRARGLLSEAAAAVARAEAAVAAGCPPSQVAILVTSESVYRKPLDLALAKAGLEANVAVTEPLAATALGAWLEAAAETLAQGEAVDACLTFLAHPLTHAWLRRQSFDFDFPLSVFAEALASAASRHNVHTGLGSLARALARQERLKRAVETAAERLAAFAGEGLRPLTAWTAAFRALLSDFFPVGLAERDARVLSTKEACESFADSLELAAQALDPPLSTAAFLKIVRAQLLTADVRGTGEPLSGVQVLSIAEARYVPFAHVIVLGCCEGDFPRALPKDHLLDNYLKSRMGLPGWQLLEAIEDTTFHLLKARLPALELFYPERRGVMEMVRSRFVEGLLAEGLASVHEAELVLPEASPTNDATTAGMARRRGPRGVPAKTPEPLELVAWTATSLEALIRCPYRYLLHELGVRDLPLPLAGSPLEQGKWLHAVLERFFTDEDDPLLLDFPPEGLEDYALARLVRLADKIAPPEDKHGSVYLQAVHKGFPAFAARLASLYGDAGFGRAAHGGRELALGARLGGEDAAVRIGARHVAAEGRIDAVDPLDDAFVVTDYKRHEPPSPADARRGLSPQLPFYAAALAGLTGESNWPLSQAIAGYWNILDGTWTLVGVGREAHQAAEARGLCSKRQPPALEEAVDATLALAAWRWDGVTAEGRYAPDAGRCGTCRLMGVCRRDDPELGEELKGSSAIDARLRKGPTDTPATEEGP